MITADPFVGSFEMTSLTFWMLWPQIIQL